MIKKGININNALKLYAVLFSCIIHAKGQRPSGFKAIIKSIFKTNFPSLMDNSHYRFRAAKHDGRRL